MNSTKTLLAVAALAVGGLVGTAGLATAQTSYGDRGLKAAAKPDKELDAIERTIMTDADYDTGLDALDAYLKKNPKSVRALNLKAWTHNHIDEYEDAKQAADKVLALDLFNPEAWREKGYACWKLGDLETARTNLYFAIQDAPKNVTSYKYLISVLEEMGRTREAKKVKKMLEEMEAANADNPFNK